MSELKVNKISPRSGTAVTLGDSGDTFTIPSGATLAIQGTVSGFTSAGIDDNATSVAITISSDEDVTFTEDIKLADNKTAIFGASSDLQIFHSSTSGNSFIKDVGAGALILGSDGTKILLQKTDGENMGVFNTDGSVDLYHNNAKKFETTSTGATITGNITATGNLTSLGIDDNATSVAITIDSAESLGLGTTAPFNSRPGSLTISNEAPTLYMEDTNGSGSQVGQFLYQNAAFTFTTGSRNGTSTQNSTQHLIINDVGNVGIGGVPATVNQRLFIEGNNSNLIMAEIKNMGGAVGLQLTANNGTDAKITFGDLADNGRGRIIYSNSDESMRFDVNNLSEAMRIDSAGRLLVGKTAEERNNVGLELNPVGKAVITRSGGTTLELNRKSSDGDLINFFKDNTAVGSIGIESAGFFIDGEALHTGLIFTSNSVSPRDNGSATNNATDLGNSAGKWKDLYLGGNAVIGGGAYLGGTAAANKLEDYEEGSFTPSFAATNCSFNYTQRFGNYTKIGRVVHCKIFLRAQSSGSTSNALKITALPFTSSNTNGMFASCTFGQIYIVDLTDASRIVGQVGKNNTQIDLQFTVDNSASGNLVASAIDNSTSAGFIVDVTYFTDA